MTAPDERVRLGIWLNGRPYPVNDRGEHLPIVVAENRYHVLDLPVDAIDRNRLGGTQTYRPAGRTGMTSMNRQCIGSFRIRMTRRQRLES